MVSSSLSTRAPDNSVWTRRRRCTSVCQAVPKLLEPPKAHRASMHIRWNLFGHIRSAMSRRPRRRTAGQGKKTRLDDLHCHVGHDHRNGIRDQMCDIVEREQDQKHTISSHCHGTYPLQPTPLCPNRFSQLIIDSHVRHTRSDRSQCLLHIRNLHPLRQAPEHPERRLGDKRLEIRA